MKLKGLGGLSASLKSMSDDFKQKAISAAAGAGTDVLRDSIKATAPEDTGALKESVQAKRAREASQPGIEFYGVGIFKVPGKTYADTRARKILRRFGSTYYVDPPTFYWRFLEFGTVKMAAQPFIVPGFDKARSAAEEKVKEVLRAHATGTRGSATADAGD